MAEDLSLLHARAVVVEDDRAAACWTLLAAAARARGTDVADVAPVRLDRSAWGVALAASGGDVLLVVGEGRRGDDLAAVLADPRCRAVALPDDGRARPAEALLGTGLRLGADDLGATAAESLGLDADTGVVVLPLGADVDAVLLTGLLGRRGATGAPSPVAAGPMSVPWRMAASGRGASGWVAGAGRGAPVPTASATAEDHTTHVDVLVAGEGATEATVAAAHRLGAAVLDLRDEPDDEATVAVGDLTGPDRVPPVATAAVGPTGWRRDAQDRYALVLGPDGDADALAAALELVGGDRERLLVVGAGGDVPLQRADLAAALQVVRDVRGVVEPVGLHRDPVAAAHRLAAFATAGVPVLLGGLEREVRELLGDQLAEVLAGTTDAELSDPDLRERRSVLLRRAAFLSHSPGARWRSLAPRLGLPVPPVPTISIVMSTNRVEFLEQGVAQALHQTWPSTELVVAFHGGPAMSGHRDAVLAAGRDAGVPTQVVEVDPAEPLGHALNVAAEHASGRWVSKMDDDDWYSPDHLVDLMLAADASGAHLVGKAAEFIFLAEADLTIRRFGTGQDTASRTIAGATQTVRADVLRDVGGFARRSLAEDQALTADVLAAGGTIRRTHGYGLLVNRHGRHSWEVDAGYFRDAALAERPGRDHDWSLT